MVKNKKINWWNVLSRLLCNYRENLTTHHADRRLIPKAKQESVSRCSFNQNQVSYAVFFSEFTSLSVSLFVL